MEVGLSPLKEGVMTRFGTSRIWSGLVGCLFVLVGWFSWVMVVDYSPLAFETVTRPDGIVEVWEPGPDSQFTDRIRGDSEALEAAGGTLVFTGSQAEADAYIDQRHEDVDNYLLPALALGVGGILLVMAFIPGRKERIDDRRLVNT
jgi:hypothetical protein